MKNNLLSACAGIIFLLSANTSDTYAQWATHGPYGGPVNAIEASGGNLFMGNSNGVFSSADNGGTWSSANTSLERKPVSAMAVVGPNIFAGVYDSGVYFSSNNGTSWTARNTGLSNYQISSMFAADSGLYVGTSDGVFFSSDQGMNWNMANTGITPTYVIYSFAQMGDTVYAGSYGAGLYWSNNNGSTWNSVMGSIPTSSFVYALASNGNDLFAGTSAGIFKSSDRGLTWTLSNTGFPSGMWAKAFAIKPGYIFAGTYSEGMFVSTDNGASWTPINTGIPDYPFPSGLPHNYPTVNDIAVSGSNVVAATADGNYLSSDNGATWTWMNQGVMGVDVTAIASQGTLVFAGTDRNGVYKSNDNGITWTRINNGLTSIDIETLTFNGTSVFVGTMGELVFRSDDLGATWVPASTGLINDATTLESSDSLILAITAGSVGAPAGLFRSTNGMSWTEIPTTATSFLSSVAISGARIYAGNYTGGMFYTDNNGINWTNISTGLPSSRITAIHVGDGTIHIGTFGDGVYMSSDSGSTWSAANTGLGNLDITDIAEVAGTLYVSTWGGGVYQSNSGGATWSAYNTSLADLYVRNLTASAGLHAGTDTGVYTVILETSVHALQRRELDIAVYPNPTTGRFFFNVSLKQKVKITVTTPGGELIYEYSGYPEAGQSIDLNGFASGLYFLNLQTEKESVQRKIVLQ